MIDFTGLAADLLARADSVVPEWLPAGKRRGHEWVCGDLYGEAGDSCSVNLSTGLWADFAADIKGGDLISLYAAIRDISQGAAARELAPERFPVELTRGGATPLLLGNDPARVLRHSQHGVPTAWWAYTDAQGATTGYIARYGNNGSKQILPWRWIDGRWQSRGWPKPRPLYQLHRLAAAERILIVEGEKTADAAQRLLPGYIATTWQGGAQAVKHADWAPIAGKSISLWPDADEPGVKAMQTLAGILAALGCAVRILRPEGAPDAWDLADAEADGWDTARVIEWAKPRTSDYTAAVAESGPVSGVVMRGRPKGEPNERTLQPNTATSIHVLWPQLGIESGPGGVPHANAANIVKVLAGHSLTAGKIWYDTFKTRIMTIDDGDAREWTKNDYLRLLVWLQEDIGLPKVNIEAAKQGLLAYALRSQRDELTDWIKSLVWDKTERLRSFLSDVYGCAQDDYHAAVGRCWLTAMIARALDPGCKVDTVPVLYGGQGIYKSTSLEKLVGLEWLAALPQKFGDRDWLQCTDGKWLVEIPDLSGFQGRNLEHIKAFITIREDRYCRRYGYDAETFSRRFVMVGTTNSQTFNADITGGRRFLPVKVGGHINIEYIEQQREQLFAEAYALYLAKTPWWDIPLEEAQGHQEATREVHPFEDTIEEWLHRPGNIRLSDDGVTHYVSSSALLWECLGIEPGRQSGRDSGLVGSIMRKLGFSKPDRITVRGQRFRAFILQKSEILDI